MSTTSSCRAWRTRCWCVRRMLMPGSRAIATARAAALPGVLGDHHRRPTWPRRRSALCPAAGASPCATGRKMVEPPHPVLAADTRAPCRRSGRLRGRGDAGGGARRGGRGRGRLRGLAAQCRSRASGLARPRQDLARSARQSLLRLGRRRCRSGGRGVRPRGRMSTTVKLINNRVHASPMETRGAIGHYDPSSDRYTLYTSNQNPHIIRVLLSAATLEHLGGEDQGGRARCRRRLRHEDLSLCRGGAGRLRLAPRAAAGQVDLATAPKPISSDTHARDHVTTVSHRARPRTAWCRRSKVDTIANMGAYLSTFAPAIPSFFYAYPMPGPVQGARGALPGPRRLHQHRAGRCLSRRRAAGGDLCAGAVDGCRRAGDAASTAIEIRAPQPDSGRCVPLQDAAAVDL